MITKLDHIGIAVTDLDAAVAAYTKGLGLSCAARETVEGERVHVAFLPVGETRLELLASTDPDGPVARFVRKKGEGVHHLCFEVRDLRASLAACATAGLKILDSEPRRGAEGSLVAFVHPRSTHGVLIELREPARPSAS